MAKKNIAGALVGTAIRGGLGFALSRGKIDPITGIASAPTTGDRFRTAARLTIPAYAAEDRFQTEQEQLGITRAGLAESRARTNIAAFEAESQDRLRQAQTATATQKTEQEANLDKRLDFDTILPQGLKGDSFLIPEVKDLLTSMGAGLNKDGEITARTFKELNDTDEGRQSFQRGMKGIIERRLGNLDKSETILKGSLKTQLDKFNEANATNITLDDLRNPEIREQIGDNKLLEQSKNLQGIQSKREIFRGARDKLDDVIGEDGGKDREFTKTAEELSLATFGRPFGDLSQPEQNKVVERKYKAEPERIKASMALRKEFNDLPEIKAFKEVRQRFSLMDDAFSRAQSGDLESNVALDQLLITSFNKLTDPESVVRESEYLRTPENISFINRLRGKYEKILKGGGGLTETEREELVNSANLMRNSYFKFTKEAAMQYAEIADRSGLDPELIITIPNILGKSSSSVDKNSFNELPNPAGFKGKTMTDTDTGERFKSDGSSWRLIK